MDSNQSVSFVNTRHTPFLTLVGTTYESTKGNGLSTGELL